MLKVYSRAERTGFDVAIVNLDANWLKKTGESVAMLENLEINDVPLVIESKDESAFFLVNPTMSYDPSIENFFGDNDLVFLDAEPDEIERFCLQKDYIKSNALFIRSDGMAQYQANGMYRYWTAEFDILLIHEILKTVKL